MKGYDLENPFRKENLTAMKKRFRTANLISIFIVSVLLILPSSVCAAPQAETDAVSQAEPERFGTAQWYSTYSPGTILPSNFYLKSRNFGL